MQRIVNPPGRVDADKYGTGKDGFQDGDPDNLPLPILPSTMQSDMTNSWTEEIAATVESTGSELDADDVHQMARCVHGAVERLAISNMPTLGGNGEENMNTVRHGRDQFDPDRGLFLVVGSAGRVWATEDGAVFETYAWFDQSKEITALVWYPTITRWVAGGQDGAIGLSTNGDNWVEQTNPKSDGLQAMAYGNGVVVAVGANGCLLTTTDGTTWQPQSAGTSEILRQVTYNATLDRWFVVGDQGVVRWSDGGDLITWTTIDLLVTTRFRSIATRASDGMMIIVGDEGEVYASKDGVTWDANVVASVDGGANGAPILLDVAWTRAGLAIAVGIEHSLATGASRFWTTTDAGKTWNAHKPTFDDPDDRQRSVAVADSPRSVDPNNGVVVTIGAGERVHHSWRM